MPCGACNAAKYKSPLVEMIPAVQSGASEMMNYRPYPALCTVFHVISRDSSIPATTVASRHGAMSLDVFSFFLFVS